MRAGRRRMGAAVAWQSLPRAKRAQFGAGGATSVNPHTLPPRPWPRPGLPPPRLLCTWETWGSAPRGTRPNSRLQHPKPHTCGLAPCGGGADWGAPYLHRHGAIRPTVAAAASGGTAAPLLIGAHHGKCAVANRGYDIPHPRHFPPPCRSCAGRWDPPRAQRAGRGTGRRAGTRAHAMTGASWPWIRQGHVPATLCRAPGLELGAAHRVVPIARDLYCWLLPEIFWLPCGGLAFHAMVRGNGRVLMEDSAKKPPP